MSELTTPLQDELELIQFSIFEAGFNLNLGSTERHLFVQGFFQQLEFLRVIDTFFQRFVSGLHDPSLAKSKGNILDKLSFPK